MDIPTMAPNQSISGRQIKLVKNEFKINILEDTKTLGLWRVDIQVKNRILAFENKLIF